MLTANDLKLIDELLRERGSIMIPHQANNVRTTIVYLQHKIAKELNKFKIAVKK
jgi:hypothetical protein